MGRSRGSGPALGMSVEDHELTRTYRGRGKKTMAVTWGFRHESALLRDVRDIRKLFGQKYNKGLLEMLKYAKTQGI
jgi:hypothetical protein